MPEATIERLEVAEPEWGFTMNAYIVRDPATSATAIVDPGAEPERILAAAGDKVAAIWITHGDWDHINALPQVRAATEAPVYCHSLDADRVPGGVDILVSQGYGFRLGGLNVRVLYVPGHSPGHVVYVVGHKVLGGDVLFPGGPGRTRSPEDFQMLRHGLAEQLFTLDDNVIVYPGHGEPVTIGQAKQEYAEFLNSNPPADLYGDVTWLGE